MLDVECGLRGSPESYVAKVRAQHKHNGRLFEPSTKALSAFSPPAELQRAFGIQHFAGRVVYEASDCLGILFKLIPIGRNLLTLFLLILQIRIETFYRTI